jgi:hypothetical protein
MIDTNRGTVENTIPQLIHKLDDSDSSVRRAVVNGIVELAKNGLLTWSVDLIRSLTYLVPNRR